MTWENKPCSLNIPDFIFLALVDAKLIPLIWSHFFVKSDVEIKAKWLKGKIAHTASRLLWPSIKLGLTCDSHPPQPLTHTHTLSLPESCPIKGLVTWWCGINRHPRNCFPTFLQGSFSMSGNTVELYSGVEVDSYNSFGSGHCHFNVQFVY